MTAGYKAGDLRNRTWDRGTEAPRPFCFAVTWSSLTAQLQPREIKELARAAHLPSNALAVAAPAQPAGSNGRWEMVVPKMVRTGPRTFTRVNPVPTTDSLAALLPPPMFASYGTEPLLSRAFSVIGRRTRALLTAPSVEPQDRLAARELWLSRIAKALRNRPADREGQL